MLRGGGGGGGGRGSKQLETLLLFSDECFSNPRGCNRQASHHGWLIYYGLTTSILMGNILPSSIYTNGTTVRQLEETFLNKETPRGILPYQGICRWMGYGFWPLSPEQGI